MSELLGEFMTPAVKMVAIVFLLGVVLIYLASIFWVYRDAKLRGTTAEIWAAIAIIPIIGISLYSILKPSMYENDRREQELEIARRERELYTEGYCKSCSYPIEPDYLLCPNCKVRIKKACPSCGRALKPKWDTCPYCRTEQPDKGIGKKTSRSKSPKKVSFESSAEGKKQKRVDDDAPKRTTTRRTTK